MVSSFVVLKYFAVGLWCGCWFTGAGVSVVLDDCGCLGLFGLTLYFECWIVGCLCLVVLV